MKQKFIAAALAALLTTVSIPIKTAKAAEFTVCINEICTQNKSCLTDSYGLYSDWIELYNAGNSDVDLSGYGLSDDESKPLQWTFPTGTIISAGEHMILFASKQNSSASELHTGFALSKNGETLVLTSPKGEILQKIIVPTLAEDTTYGRTPDGSSIFEVMTATPGTANETVTSAPTFSAQSGFYGTDFELTLSAANNTSIYYTLDGSDPTTSESAQLYTGSIEVCDRTNQPNIYSTYAEDENSPQSVCLGISYKQPTFNVDKPTVVRAAAKSADGIFSDVISRTYFVTTGNLAQYKDMMVVSLVTNPDFLFDSETGIYVTGNQYINWKNSSAYDPDISVWDSSLPTNYYSKGREWEREASVSVFRNGETVVEQNMGIRIKGASTRNSAQKSFNLYARSDYGASKIEFPLIDDNYSLDGTLIDEYDSVCLRSVSDEVRLRDGFSNKLISNRENITTQNMQKCAVFLNGEYWGLYELTEKFTDCFIESNYGINKEDVAMMKNDMLEEGEQTEIDNFMQFINTYSRKDMTDDANYQAVCDFIDIDSMIEHYAAGLYLGTYDWPNYNYGVWRNTGKEIAGNPYSNGKWHFMSFDFDYTMGATYENFGGVEGYAYDSFQHMDSKSGAPTNLFIQLLKNKDFRTKFVNVYCDYANEVLTPEKADEMAELYSQEYTEQLANTAVRWWGYFGGSKESNLSYHRNFYQNTTLKQIRTFFQQRAEYTIEDMRNYLGLQSSMQTITLKTKGNGKIQINTIIPDTANGWSGEYSPDCPVTLTAIPDEDASFTGWSGDLSGMDKTVTLTLSEAMSIQANFGEQQSVKGDVNADGKFNIADIAMMQKWLLAVPDTSLADWKAGDLCENDEINVFDLCLMKHLLLNS
ncbi:MAG: CotH kinase family protein [Oscillospiraceae bacterium]